MALGTELTRMVTAIDALVAGVEADLKTERPKREDVRMLRAEIENAIQKLDQLREKLGASGR